MKTIFYSFLVLMLASCTTFKVFIPVTPRMDVPKDTQYIIVNADLEQVKSLFNSNGIMTKSMEGGFETESFLIDEGTRAMYKVHQFDDQVRISAFWGITQKVKAQTVAWAGYAAASAYDVHAFDQVTYNAYSQRPKSVFDYAVQIVETAGLPFMYR